MLPTSMSARKSCNGKVIDHFKVINKYYLIACFHRVMLSNIEHLLNSMLGICLLKLYIYSVIYDFQIFIYLDFNMNDLESQLFL